jgi:hypothetical protein
VGRTFLLASRINGQPDSSLEDLNHCSGEYLDAVCADDSENPRIVTYGNHVDWVRDRPGCGT